MNKKNNFNKTSTKRWFYVAVCFGVFFAIVTTFIAICRNINNSEETTIFQEKDCIETENNLIDIEKNKTEDLNNKETKKNKKTKDKDKKECKTTKNSCECEGVCSCKKDLAKKTSTPVNNVAKESQFIKPVEGEIINPHSENKHVFWDVTGDWRTHNAIDIKANKNTPVKAISNGVVTEIKNDSNAWGICITIDHENGFKSIYKGLGDEVTVKTDQKVETGDVIGIVGDTNKIEKKENKSQEHLHFELKKNNEFVNPKRYIKF